MAIFWMIQLYLFVFHGLSFCFFPFFCDETVVINAKRFVLRPEVHYNQVHAVDDKKSKKMKLSVPVSDYLQSKNLETLPLVYLKK